MIQFPRSDMAFESARRYWQQTTDYSPTRILYFSCNEFSLSGVVASEIEKSTQAQEVQYRLREAPGK